MTDEEYMRDPDEVAREKGLMLVLPSAHELFVDIDDTDGMKQFYAAIPLVEATIGTVCISKRPSPSGKENRFHVTVELKRPVKDAFERIMLQTLLGSDRLHESLSWVRATAKHAIPTCFFEKKPPQLTEKASVSS